MCDIKYFVELPFKSQLHQCCLLYCKNNHLSPYRNRKPSSDYFKCRAYLWKLPTQDIKNIAIMLMEKPEQIYLYDLQKKSQEYVAEKQDKANRSKVKLLKAQEQYDMDRALADFLG